MASAFAGTVSFSCSAGPAKDIVAVAVGTGSFNTLVAAVKTMQAKTVNGQELALVVGASGVTVNSAKVVATDIAASNGVIHV